MNMLAIGASKIASGKAEIMDGVEQVGLTDAIRAANTGYSLGKTEKLLPVVLKMNQRY
mgnify:CR=1 FL=1